MRENRFIPKHTQVHVERISGVNWIEGDTLSHLGRDYRQFRKKECKREARGRYMSILFSWHSSFVLSISGSSMANCENKHVMLLNQWNNKADLLEIYDALITHEYFVRMDVKGEMREDLHVRWGARVTWSMFWNTQFFSETPLLGLYVFYRKRIKALKTVKPHYRMQKNNGKMCFLFTRRVIGSCLVGVELVSSDESGEKTAYHGGIVFSDRHRGEQGETLMKPTLNGFERCFSLLGCVKLSVHIQSSKNNRTVSSM